MSRISKLLSVLRVIKNDVNITDIKIDSGGGSNITAENFSPSGDDSFPLITDYVLSTNTMSNGGQAVIGFIDPISKAKSNEGDKRIYARNPEDGATVAEMWLKNDGTVVASNIKGSVTLEPSGSIKGVNGNGSFELQPGGDFVVNGVIIASDGSVTISNSLTLAGKEIAGHDHPITWTDPAGSGTSGANN